VPSGLAVSESALSVPILFIVLGGKRAETMAARASRVTGSLSQAGCAEYEAMVVLLELSQEVEGPPANHGGVTVAPSDLIEAIEEA
jgi:hypothetical protein